MKKFFDRINQGGNEISAVVYLDGILSLYLFAMLNIRFVVRIRYFLTAYMHCMESFKIIGSSRYFAFAHVIYTFPKLLRFFLFHLILFIKRIFATYINLFGFY